MVLLVANANFASCFSRAGDWPRDTSPAMVSRSFRTALRPRSGYRPIVTFSGLPLTRYRYNHDSFPLGRTSKQSPLPSVTTYLAFLGFNALIPVSVSAMRSFLCTPSKATTINRRGVHAGVHNQSRLPVYPGGRCETVNPTANIIYKSCGISLDALEHTIIFQYKKC